MLTWRWFTLGFVVCLVTWGCEPPKAIVPSTAPGAPPLRTLPESEKKSPPEALGEQSATARPGSPKGEGETAKPKVDPSAPTAPPTAKGETKTTPSGVKYETLKEGTGAEAKPGQRVSVHYTGTLENGTEFDSSRDRGPFPFTIGMKEVITGWDEGIPGMKVGERRKLIVPPSAGYKDKDMGKIPPNSTLIFDVELIDVK